jgi:hypothetical protein
MEQAEPVVPNIGSLSFFGIRQDDLFGDFLNAAQTHLQLKRVVIVSSVKVRKHCLQ